MVADAPSRVRFGLREFSLVVLVKRFFRVKLTEGLTEGESSATPAARSLSGSATQFWTWRAPSGPDFRSSDVKKNVNSA